VEAVARRRCHDVEHVSVFGVFAVVFAELDCLVLGVVLDVYGVVGGEVEALTGGVKLLGGVGPGVAIGGDEVAAVADVAVVEVVVRGLDHVLEADPHPYPPHELFHLDPPLRLPSCIQPSLPSGRGYSIRQKRWPLDSIPDCSASI
jgi:hypothetical protein